MGLGRREERDVLPNSFFYLAISVSVLCKEVWQEGFVLREACSFSVSFSPFIPSSRNRKGARDQGSIWYNRAIPRSTSTIRSQRPPSLRPGQRKNWSNLATGRPRTSSWQPNSEETKLTETDRKLTETKHLTCTGLKTQQERWSGEEKWPGTERTTVWIYIYISIPSYTASAIARCSSHLSHLLHCIFAPVRFNHALLVVLLDICCLHVTIRNKMLACPCNRTVSVLEGELLKTVQMHLVTHRSYIRCTIKILLLPWIHLFLRN
jgi:hypothetical protein